MRPSFASDATTFRRTATVVRQRSDVFDGFDLQTGLRQGGDGHIATATGTFDANVDFFHTEFLRFIGGLLSGHLPRKRRALTTAFESARAGRSPAKRVALHIGDRHVCVIETNFDVRDAASDVSLDLTFLRNLSHFNISNISSVLNFSKRQIIFRFCSYDKPTIKKLRAQN